MNDRIADRFASARLTMRPALVADAEALHEAYRDPLLMRWWSSAPQADLQTTRDYLAPREGRDWQNWAITLGDDDTAIGTLAAHPHRPRVWEIGYLLVRDHWGHGYAGEAVTALIDLLFGTAAARRVYADVDPDNARSLQLLERLGFRREGLLRAEWETHIGVRDSVILGLLADEWRVSS
ncbi:GNAT family N-acetyltransferase [Sphingomonas sp.]|uniref:GNAT family N-acetyltransferase n=1 Tax=Sphingomonas sp. TaxID=28214 RepID=UPI003AFF8A50